MCETLDGLQDVLQWPFFYLAPAASPARGHESPPFLSSVSCLCVASSSMPRCERRARDVQLKRHKSWHKDGYDHVTVFMLCR